MDLLRIRNVGERPLVLRHDEKGDVTIEPGQERILPAEYAYVYFGNPAARDVGKDKSREFEWRRCRTLWGFYGGLMGPEDWERIRPKFECYDLDGNRVYMVLDDPDGTLAGAAPSAAQSDAVERAGMEAQIAALQAQVDRLSRMLVAQTTGAPGTVPAPDLPPPPADVEPTEVSLPDPPGETQAERNAARDDIPEPPADEPPVTADAPRTTRIGGR